MSIDLYSLAWKTSFPGKPLKKLVLLCLADYTNDHEGYAWPSYDTMVDRCGASRRGIINAVNELEADGWLRREQRTRNDGQPTSNAYWINTDRLRAAAAEFDGRYSEQSAPRVANSAPQGGAQNAPPSEQNAPLGVNTVHRGGAQNAPGGCTECTPGGAQNAPYLLSELLTDPLSELSATTATTSAPAREPSPPAAAVAAVAVDLPSPDSVNGRPAPNAAAVDLPVPVPDPIPAILDWIDFGDTLTADERRTLAPPTLLAWAYSVKLTRSAPGTRINNPVGLARALWRKGERPRADLLTLARRWLALDDDQRRRLLNRAEWWTGFDPDNIPPGEEFIANLPLGTAAAVFAAAGALAPPALSPTRDPVAHKLQAAQPAAPPAAQSDIVPVTAQQPRPPANLWRDALAELKLQIPRDTFATYFQGSVAAGNGDGLTVYVRSPRIAEWIAGRFDGLIHHTVEGLAGRPVNVRYEVRHAA